MSFRALVLSQGPNRKVSGAVETLDDSRLSAGDVTVAVEYSTLNYKDGLVLTSGGGLVKTWPHVGGIDFAGTAETSDNAGFKPGDKVVLNGWRVGELHWGGYATRARVKGDWLVKLPPTISTKNGYQRGRICGHPLRAEARRARLLGQRRDSGHRRCGWRRQPSDCHDGKTRIADRGRHRPTARKRLFHATRGDDDHGPQGADRGARPSAPGRALRRGDPIRVPA